MASASGSFNECAWVTAPGAGGTIVSYAAGAVPARNYLLTVYFGYVSGALGASEQTTSGGNFQLFVGNSQIGNLSNGFLNAMPVLGTLQMRQFRIYLDGATSVSLVANQASSAGVIYAGQIILDGLSS